MPENVNGTGGNIVNPWQRFVQEVKDKSFRRLDKTYGSVFNLADNNKSDDVDPFEYSLFFRGYIDVSKKLENTEDIDYKQLNNDITEWLKDENNVFGLSESKLSDFENNKKVYSLPDEIYIDGKKYVNTAKGKSENFEKIESDSPNDKIYQKTFKEENGEKTITVRTTISNGKIKREIIDTPAEETDTGARSSEEPEPQRTFEQQIDRVNDVLTCLDVTTNKTEKENGKIKLQVDNVDNSTLNKELMKLYELGAKKYDDNKAQMTPYNKEKDETVKEKKLELTRLDVVERRELNSKKTKLEEQLNTLKLNNDKDSKDPNKAVAYSYSKKTLKDGIKNLEKEIRQVNNEIYTLNNKVNKLKTELLNNDKINKMLEDIERIKLQESSMINNLHRDY